MERIFKIKTRTDPDLSNQYPSERRYSASIVLGFSAIFLNLSLCSALMGGLIIHKIALFYNTDADNFDGNGTEDGESVRRLTEKLERDMAYSDQTYLHYYINVPALIVAGCFLMAFGDMLAFITGIFASKHWYIDHNITFFFLTCSFSMITSSISLLISVLTSTNIKFDMYEDYEPGHKDFFPVSLHLAINIVILSCISLLWSFLSTKVAYSGMRNSYPDGTVMTGGRIEISTIRKGGKNNDCNNFPIEVINNLVGGKKMLKYLVKKENSDLPKDESNSEYQQRVKNFLSGEPEDKSGKKEVD